MECHLRGTCFRSTYCRGKKVLLGLGFSKSMPMGVGTMQPGCKGVPTPVLPSQPSGPRSHACVEELHKAWLTTDWWQQSTDSHNLRQAGVTEEGRHHQFTAHWLVPTTGMLYRRDPGSLQLLVETPLSGAASLVGAFLVAENKIILNLKSYKNGRTMSVLEQGGSRIDIQGSCGLSCPQKCLVKAWTSTGRECSGSRYAYILCW